MISGTELLQYVINFCVYREKSCGILCSTAEQSDVMGVGFLCLRNQTSAVYAMPTDKH